MPELPEVETICRELRQSLHAKPSVAKVKVHRRDLRVEEDSKFKAHFEP